MAYYLRGSQTLLMRESETFEGDMLEIPLGREVLKPVRLVKDDSHPIILAASKAEDKFQDYMGVCVDMGLFLCIHNTHELTFFANIPYDLYTAEDDYHDGQILTRTLCGKVSCSLGCLQLKYQIGTVHRLTPDAECFRVRDAYFRSVSAALLVVSAYNGVIL